MSAQENLRITHTLCLLTKDDEVLLAMKKREFGVGKWNAPGGTRKDESAEETAIRETKEEVGVIPKSITQVATLDCKFPDKPEWDRVIGVYTAEEWTGEIKESEEMRPQWFNKGKMPYDQMWEADRHWLPRVLSGETLAARLIYNSKQELQEFKVLD